MAPPIGIQLYTVRDLTKDQKHAAVLQELGKIGYRGVEVGRATFDLSLADFRKLVEDCGMVVASRFGPPPTRDNAAEIIDAQKALGTDLAVAGFGDKEFASLDSIKQIADTLNVGVELLEQAGITLCLHNHWWEMRRLDGKLAYELLIERCPKLELEIDTYWAAGEGSENPIEIVRRWRDRAPLLHLKDGLTYKAADPMTALGRGKQDFPAIFAAADSKRLRWALLELDRCATDMMQAVRDSYRYVVDKALAVGARP